MHLRMTGDRAEPVQAVIQDPVSPLVAVDLSDGSTITVTADHPFWVDRGALLQGRGWLAAGQLWPGDRLRAASGTTVLVVGVRRGVGRAPVYTLTVATDHSFFVGSGKVLVHNRECDPQAVAKLAQELKFTDTTIRHQAEADRRVPLHLLAEAILYGKRVPDPQAAPGAVKIVVDDFFFDITLNGRVVTRAGKHLTIIYREVDKTILHYDYYN